MEPVVHILASCRNRSLWRATTLVLDTIRTGFPTWKVCVWANGLPEDLSKEMEQLCERERCDYIALERTIHHIWIESLVHTTATATDGSANNGPTLIFCDTDMVFWSSVEGWKFETALAGRLIPEFYDEFTNCRTVARLHPSLLWVNLIRLEAALKFYLSGFLETAFNPLVNLFYPVHLPPRLFYDTCAGLYQAVGGTAFGERELNCYDHFFCGTISDLVGPHVSDGKMQDRQRSVMAKPAMARGMWREQQRYFEHWERVARSPALADDYEPEQVPIQYAKTG